MPWVWQGDWGGHSWCDSWHLLELWSSLAGTCTWALLQSLMPTSCPKVLPQALASSAQPGDGAGSFQPTGCAVLMSWDGFPRAKGSLDAPPRPDFPCLPSMHRPERRETKDVPGVTQQPGSRKQQSQRRYWLLRDKPGGLGNFALFGDSPLTCLIPIFGMGGDTGCMICGFPARPAFWRCCKGDEFLTLDKFPCLSLPIKRRQQDNVSRLSPGCQSQCPADFVGIPACGCCSELTQDAPPGSQIKGV